ncbi:copper chaperone PCu(A)C [Burkholderiaceae bacterium FT117]|uniref:copper chaperone PCu(A)C n=1 Tax=Zeimonas sediminis TaxID=2944268 RepID=UPI002342CD93|nr:copper chaperone PCu(A)C [Zeimonas sediminis]MCM5569899.1 copper chaperone PCu(A)C [Zeimonas sediminis]
MKLLSQYLPSVPAAGLAAVLVAAAAAAPMAAAQTPMQQQMQQQQMQQMQQAQQMQARQSAGPAAKVGSLSIGNPWARATAPGAAVGGGFMLLENAGGADRLVGASSPVSESVELHTMSMENNVMRMREVQAIDLPAGQRVELRPGGLHIMFINLKAPLKAGDTFPVRLRFEKAGEVEVGFKVEAMGAMGGPAGGGMHQGGMPHGATMPGSQR